MISVTPSGNEDRQVRITAPGRDPLDVTRPELAALVHEARMYLMRTCPPPPFGGGVPDSGG
ncbi:hypothetical protein [Embleya sp. AB8]|uniref:hypothetical protein n=1 Tax=Embleya sp. AB8 TaxID=3156304 RepID=UPI003C711748